MISMSFFQSTITVSGSTSMFNTVLGMEGSTCMTSSVLSVVTFAIYTFDENQPVTENILKGSGGTELWKKNFALNTPELSMCQEFAPDVASGTHLVLLFLLLVGLVHGRRTWDVKSTSRKHVVLFLFLCVCSAAQLVPSGVGVQAIKLRSWNDISTNAYNLWNINKPSARTGVRMVKGADGSIYMFGGKVGEIRQNDIFKLDMETHEWVKITTSGQTPNVRTDHAMSSLGYDIYLFGGAQDGTASGKDLSFPSYFPHPPSPD